MTQATLPNFIRASARAARRAAVSLDIASGLLVDVFAGFGGGSIASERAHGRPVNIAINHWPVAIQYHEHNHPLPTKHFTADVREIDPEDATDGEPVLHAHFSPDCRHYSSAKGGQPVSDGVRALPWVVLRWAKAVRPTLITMENVKEFLGWGPTEPFLKGGDIQYWPSGEMKRVPVKDKRGLTFKIWLGRLRAMGYEVDWKILDAAAYGAPTHRKRLFLVARCDGKSVVWPKPTHGSVTKVLNGSRSAGIDDRNVRHWEQAGLFGESDRPDDRDAAGLLPYRTAAECIDFSRPCPSIFMNREDARAFKRQTGIQCQRPLKKKTLWRIANGVQRYVIEAAKPFIVQTGYGERPGQGPRVDNVEKPLGTVVGTGKRGVVDADLSPLIVRSAHGDGEGKTQRWGRGNQPITEPLPTVTGSKDFSVVAAALQKYYGQGVGQPLTVPMHTVTTKDRMGLIAANMINVQHGGGDVRAKSVEEPVGAITAKHGTAVAASNLIKFRGDSDGAPVDAPMPTITAGGQAGGREAGAAHAMGVAAAFLAKLRGSGGWKAVDAPLDTVCAGAPTFAHVAAVLVKFYGTSKAADIMKPLATITAGAGGGHLGLIHATLAQGTDDASLAGFWRVYAFLVEHLGENAPLPLVEAEGQLYLIVDLGMRMLEPFELLNAQFGPELAKDYVLPTNKALAVRLIGNSVSPPVLEAVIRAQHIAPPHKRKAA